MGKILKITYLFFLIPLLLKTINIVFICNSQINVVNLIHILPCFAVFLPHFMTVIDAFKCHFMTFMTVIKYSKSMAIWVSY